MLYAVTIFLSSLLLFVVQPLIARLILPWFGGTAAVWTTCMLFFQTGLLAGYAYAHAANARLAPRTLAIVHTLLLAAAVATLPIAPAEWLKPGGAEDPTLAILVLLLATVGLPYVLLSATSPLVQAWFARARPGQNPYRLFALSNVASLLALIGYPLAVEPWLGGRAQVETWSWLFAAFALACAALAWHAARQPAPAPAALQAEGPPPSRTDYALWLALSATGSALLLAVTNHVTQNVASVPLLWLAPLTLYLLTFIVAFDGRDWHRSRFFWVVLLVAVAAMAWLVADSSQQFVLWLQLGVYLAGLFVACLFCHGELYAARPAAGRLTAYYLAISAGGALGGLFVAVLAPLAFDAYYELGIALIALAFLAAIRLAPIGRVAYWASLAVLMGTAGAAVYDGLRFQRNVLESARNFYGVVRVKEYGAAGEEAHLRRLVHGVIMHGEQHMSEGMRRVATTYYQASSGIGVAIASRQERKAIRVGVVGLGAGTLAVYGRKGDVYRFYEINSKVVELATTRFTFLGDSAARIEHVLGDARLNLEREAPQQYDVLAVDAFSSDSIPVHLITKEALGAYLRHLKPDGIVAFHVSNRFLRLAPVVQRLAKEHGAHAVHISDAGKDDDDTQTDWVLVSRDPKALEHREIEAASPEPPEEQASWRTWTDDYSNLLQIIK